MKILILTYGSRGDVQPFIAFGKGLVERGHQVVLATSERFRYFVEENGLIYGYMNDEMLAILDTDRGKDLLENTANFFQAIKKTLSMMQQVGPLQKALLRESWEVAQKEKPGLIVFHPKAYAAPHIAEKLGIPVVLALPVPLMVPTSERPNIGFPNLRLGGWYNRQTYHMVNRLMGFSAKKHLKEFRANCGLPPQKKFDLLRTNDGTEIPVLHAHSKHVIPEPTDWPDKAITSGFWFLENNKEWLPPQELQDFLQTGSPPVYIGFGSMSGKNPERLANIVIESLTKANLRGVLATGWGGLKARELPRDILQIEHAPHDWLFPQMAAVVHHGGAGTTAAGLRAGKPSIVVPFFGDQPFWGKRIHELGVGPKPIPHKRLTSEALTAALTEATSNKEMMRAAEELGEKIREENGVSCAVSFIEEILQRSKTT